jgi:two-component system, LytTR family, sensor kinase
LLSDSSPYMSIRRNNDGLLATFCNLVGMEIQKTTTRKTVPKITTAEVSTYCLALFILGMMYYTALYFNRNGYADPNVHFFNIRDILNWGGIDYALKFLLTLPVIWLMFFKLPHIKLSYRLLIHLVTLPLFVLLWQQIYYAVTEAIGMFHLTGLGSTWDLYIPALFYILVFSMLHAYMYFKQVQEQQLLEAELREMALKSELTALKAQLNPHFLYNVFNSINASLSPDQEKTRQMVAELADLFRYQLRASKSELVPLREELEFTRKYLHLEKVRFDDRLHVVIDVDENLLDEQVPPMLLQPLVENAVKHGIAPLIEGGSVMIKIIRKDGRLDFTITDTGQGLIGNKQLLQSGTGVSNTARRLEKMFGTKLEFTDHLPRGLSINFSF